MVRLTFVEDSYCPLRLTARNLGNLRDDNDSKYLRCFRECAWFRLKEESELCSIYVIAGSLSGLNEFGIVAHDTPQ